ncbi:hypothetical protein PFISCL1PPCAC_19266, partial [Pristionchus fissidentatus]
TTDECNNCLKDPCPNLMNYTCTNGHNTRNCTCKPSNAGNNCEYLVGDPCASYPCMNGGTCTGNTASKTYKCQCPAGRYGTQCQFAGDACSNVTCAVTGQCTKIFD